MTALRLDLADEAATVAAGRAMGEVLRAGDLLALDGELGAGKTTLVRGIASGLGIAESAVRSPTFVLCHVYRGPRLTLHHADLYRLGPGADVGFLDLETLLEDGAVVVEWAEHADLRALGPAHLRLDAGPSATRRVLTLAGGAPSRIASALSGCVR